MKPTLANEQPTRIDSAARLEESAGLFLHVAGSDYRKSMEKAAMLMAGEMAVRFQTNRRALPALALSVDSAVLA